MINDQRLTKGLETPKLKEAPQVQVSDTTRVASSTSVGTQNYPFITNELQDLQKVLNLQV